MLARLARWCVTHKWITIFAIWVPILVGVNVAASAAGSAFSTDFTFPDSESAEVIDQLESVSPEDAGFPGQIVYRYDGEGGVNNPEVKAAMEDIFAKVDAMDGVSVTSPYDDPSQINPDGTIAFAQVNITDRDQTEMLDFSEAVQKLDDPITEGHGAIEGLTIEYGGEIFGEFELPASELYGLIAAMIILILAFGSVLAMGLPIGTAIVGLATGAGWSRSLSHTLSMPDFTVQMAAMIGLGVGIDYALFIVQRFREGLDHGLEVEESIVEAIDTSGRAVLFAGTAVLISLCGMFLMGMAFMNGLAIGAIAGVLMMMRGLAHAAPGLPRDLRASRERDHRGRRSSPSRYSSSGRSSAWCPANPLPFLGALLLAIVVYAVSFIVKSWRTAAPAPRPEAARADVLVQVVAPRAASPVADARRRRGDPRIPDHPAVLDPARLRRHRQPARDADGPPRIRHARRGFRPRHRRQDSHHRGGPSGVRPGRARCLHGAVGGDRRRRRQPASSRDPAHSRSRDRPAVSVHIPARRSHDRARATVA